MGIEKYSTICDEQQTDKSDKTKKKGAGDVEDGEVEEIDEGTTEEHDVVEEELAGVKMLLVCYKSQPKDVREKVKAMCDEKKMERELKEIQEKVRNVKSNQSKCKYVRDLQKCYDILETENSRLETDVDGVGDGYEAVDAQSQRLKRLDETTSDMHLLGENKKLEAAIKKYENERESMMKKVHDYASEYEESYRLIRQTDGKEVHHLDTLKQHNHDIEQRMSKMDVTRRQLIETSLLAKAQNDEIERIEENLNKVTENTGEISELRKELNSFEKFSSQSQNIINGLERNLEKLNKKNQKEKNNPTD